MIVILLLAPASFKASLIYLVNVLSNGIIASADFPSPTIAKVASSTIPPLASLGIVGILKLFPPTKGTQSGIFIPLTPPISPLIPSIIQFNGVLIIPHKPLTIFSNILQIPSQAFFQSPLKTPVINVISPSKIPVTAFIAPPIASKTPLTIDQI